LAFDHHTISVDCFLVINACLLLIVHHDRTVSNLSAGSKSGATSSYFNGVPQLGQNLHPEFVAAPHAGQIADVCCSVCFRSVGGVMDDDDGRRW